jgi:hypothetical protein
MSPRSTMHAVGHGRSVGANGGIALYWLRAQVGNAGGHRGATGVPPREVNSARDIGFFRWRGGSCQGLAWSSPAFVQVPLPGGQVKTRAVLEPVANLKADTRCADRDKWIREA